MALIGVDSGLHSSTYWRARAEEARTRGEAMHGRDAAQTMFRIARIYDEMAQTAEKRESRDKPS